MTSLPLSVTVQSLANAMLAKPGLRSQFHLMIGITMSQLEAALRTPTDYVIVIDRSGSTGAIAPGGNASILDTSKEACQAVLDLLDPNDRVAVIAFDHNPQTVVNLTACDAHGKVAIGNAIWGITIGGSTAFLPALESAASLFGKETGRKQAIVFFTDGEDGGQNPVQFAKGLSAQGVTLFVGGLGISNTGEKLLEAMAGTNFKSLNNASEVSAFFASAQAQAASAVVTNAQLRLTPVNFATVTNFELVTRGGAPNYVPADSTGKLVPLGDIAVGDNQQAYLGLQVVLPENIAPGRRSFGKIELVGDVPSDGRKGEVIAATAIAVPFSATPVPGMNNDVKDMINVAATAREMYKFAQTGDQAHLAAARKTVAFSNSDVASALSAQINTINAQVASDPAAAQKQARRATKGFSAADAAAALKGLK